MTELQLLGLISNRHRGKRMSPTLQKSNCEPIARIRLIFDCVYDLANRLGNGLVRNLADEAIFLS